MAKQRKHQFHCEKCGAPCEIYKKGKNHRVLICPNCGVLATNPIKLGGILGKAYRTAKTIPVVGSIGTGLEEFGIVSADDTRTPIKPAGVSGRVHYPRPDRVTQALAVR